MFCYVWFDILPRGLAVVWLRVQFSAFVVAFDDDIACDSFSSVFRHAVSNRQQVFSPFIVCLPPLNRRIYSNTDFSSALASYGYGTCQNFVCYVDITRNDRSWFSGVWL